MTTKPIRDLPPIWSYAYLATPYSKWAEGIDDAACMAEEIAGRLIKAGVPVFSPIAHFHGIAYAADIDPMDADFWLKAEKPLLDAAAVLIIPILKGWDESAGIKQELIWADEQAKPVYFIDPENLQWSLRVS